MLNYNKVSHYLHNIKCVYWWYRTAKYYVINDYISARSELGPSSLILKILHDPDTWSFLGYILTSVRRGALFLDIGKCSTFKIKLFWFFPYSKWFSNVHARLGILISINFLSINIENRPEQTKYFNIFLKKVMIHARPN